MNDLKHFLKSLQHAIQERVPELQKLIPSLSDDEPAPPDPQHRQLLAEAVRLSSFCRSDRTWTIPRECLLAAARCCSDVVDEQSDEELAQCIADMTTALRDHCNRLLYQRRSLQRYHDGLADKIHSATGVLGILNAMMDSAACTDNGHFKALRPHLSDAVEACRAGELPDSIPMDDSIPADSDSLLRTIGSLRDSAVFAASIYADWYPVLQDVASDAMTHEPCEWLPAARAAMRSLLHTLPPASAAELMSDYPQVFPEH